MPTRDSPGKDGQGGGIRRLTARQRLARRRRSTFDPPRWPFGYLEGGRAARSTRWRRFIEGEMTLPKGPAVGQPMHLLPFQRAFLKTALDDPQVRTAVLSGARGMGKTGLVASMALAATYERVGADVVIVSTQMNTARLAFDRAVDIVAESDRLADQAIHHASASDPYLELPHRMATLRPLAGSNVAGLIGQAFTLAIVDEIGFVTRAAYEVVQSAAGKNPDSLVLGVGTPGLSTVEADGSPAMMYQLRSAFLGNDPPPGLRYVEHAADPDADPGKRSTWRQANPALGRFTSADAVELDYLTLSADRFAALRLGLWSSSEGAYITPHLWDALTVRPEPPPPGTAIAIGFDGSSSRDSTAMVATAVDSRQVFVLGHWAPPTTSAGRGYRVPRRDVHRVLADAFDTYRVVGMLADPYLWRDALVEWQDAYGDDVVQEFDTARRAKMAPATDAFASAIEHRTITVDGSDQLRAHVLSAVATMTPQGPVISKDARRPRHIDLAIAAILSHEAARTMEDPVPEIF